MIDGTTLYEFLRIADGWVRKIMDLVRSADADGAEAARAIMAVPFPPPPPATVLPPRSGSSSGGGKGGKGVGKLVQLSEERAMQYRMDLLCYLAITRLIHALKKIDTLPEPAIEALKHIVRSIVEMYGEGAASKSRSSGRCPTRSGHRGCPACRCTRPTWRTHTLAVLPVQGKQEAGALHQGHEGCREAADVRRRVQKARHCAERGLQRLLDDPKWDITKHPRPPPARRRRR